MLLQRFFIRFDNETEMGCAMRRLSGLLLIVMTGSLLCSCGGGGGSSGTPSVTYSGLLSQATITAENAEEFTEFLLGEGVVSLPPTDELVTVPAMAASLSNIPNLPTSFNYAALSTSDQKVSGSFPGSVSGSVEYSGTIYEDGTATITFTYVNFNDGDGYTYSGKATVKVLSFDFVSESILSATFTTGGLVIQGADVHLTLSGTASLEEDLSNPYASVEGFTMDFDGRDENTQKTFRLEGLSSTLTCDYSIFPPEYCSEEVGGRIYLEDEGYVEIVQGSPLLYNYYSRFNVDVPDSGGPVSLTGAGNTSVALRPISIVQVGIDIDPDGDGLYEQSIVHNWSDLVGLVFTFEVLQGTANFDVANDGLQTTDGGYVAAGWSNTMTEDGLDGYVVKLNAAGGSEWSASYGGPGDQEFQSVVQTSDGGFAMIGTSTSTATPQVDYLYVVKTDGAGTELWSRTWAGDLGDISSNGYAILENDDGSLMVAGNAYSWGPYTGYVDGNLGFEDIYLAKLDADGNLLWEKRLGGAGWDYASAMVQTGDGGYVLVGTTDSFDYSSLGEELFLVKIDANGNQIWENHFDADASSAAPLAQYGHDLVEDADGNLIAVGSSATLSSGNVPYLVKVTGGGQLLWDRLLTDENLLVLRSIDLTASGNYVLAGNDSRDVRLMEISSSGEWLWDRSFNWGAYSADCDGNSVRVTGDGGFVVFGSAWETASPDGKEVYIIKTDALGEYWQGY